MLINVYGADPGKMDVIAHGIPDVPLASARAAKERLGFTDRKVILTFGLMSPNKGIETMIEAMPEIVRRTPDVLYVVMGATHPALLAREGERYRDTLTARVRELGLDDHRSEEHTSELQSLMRISYAGFCLKTKKQYKNHI